MVKEYIKTDERNHVEEPFLLQLQAMEKFADGTLYWDVMRLDKAQQPADTGRDSFEEVVMVDKLREALRTINPWMNSDQITDALSQITSFRGRDLIAENQAILELLINGSTVYSEEEKLNKHFHYIDFNIPENNSFVAVSQLKVKVPNIEHHIYPDIVSFVNGLPLVVVECKSPKVQTPIDDAIDQMMRYSELRGEQHEGNKLLFIYNQILIATCRHKAKFGTITTPSENLFFRWTDPYPASIDELINYTRPELAEYFVGEDGNENDDLLKRTAPNDQQRMVHGMLFPTNLLNILRTFTIFSSTDKGETIKVVGRYQQYRAVYKSLERIRTGNTKQERGGLIWHTQGSGKSLTMVFLMREIWRHTELMDYKFVILTDRTQLDGQINETANRSGYNVAQIGSIEEAKAILQKGAFHAVTVMLQKFQEHDFDTVVFPQLNTSERIIVLNDEAHRSQFGKLAANFNNALPNSTNIGFTGTPTAKSEETFGDYIDTYTMQESINDGVTLEIVYEGRTAKSKLNDTDAANAAFEDVFEGINFDQYGTILNYGSRQAYMEAESTINAKAHDMFRHYVSEILPNGFKAQVVTCSLEAAHRYKLAFDKEIASAKKALIGKMDKNDYPMDLAAESKEIYLSEFLKQLNNINPEWLKNLKAEVIISATNNDRPYLQPYANPTTQKKTIESFKMSFDGKADDGTTGEVGIIIVVNMLTVGFDAPIEQVMYLDKIAVMHNLLQTITRVNRPGSPAKSNGFVVDYVGVGHHILEALKYYNDKEQNDITSSIKDTGALELELKKTMDEIFDFFTNNKVSDLTNLDALFNLFYDEDLRSTFTLLFRAVTAAINNLFPRKEALLYLNDYNLLAEISVQAAQHTRDERMNLRGVPEKLRKILDQYLESKGIDPKVAPISITDDGFAKEVERRKSNKTKAAEIEHAIRHYIDIYIKDDPEQFRSFSEILEQILLEFAGQWDLIVAQLNELRERICNRYKEDTYGLNAKTQMPYFRILKNTIFDKVHSLTPDEISCMVAVTKETHDKIELESTAIGFWRNTASQAALKGELLKILLTEEHGLFKIKGFFEKRNEIVSRLLEKARPH
jgi:type I restriction enzyme, R subunit